MKETEQSTDINQTLFTQHEPLYDPQPAQGRTEVKKPKPLLIFSVFVIIVFFLLILILFIFRGGRNSDNGSSAVTPTPSASSVHTPSQIDQMIEELEDQLHVADPSQTSQTFPPLRKEILLSE